MTFKTSADMFAVFAALPNLVPDMQPYLRTASYLLSLACSFSPKSWQTYPKSILLKKARIDKAKGKLLLAK